MYLLASCSPRYAKHRSREWRAICFCLTINFTTTSRYSAVEMPKLQGPVIQREFALKEENTERGDEELEVVEEEEDEEEEDGETRCICGEIDPPDDSGLYIQCESCSVWQHGYCVGITEGEDSSLDKYWCEQCKPELHNLYASDLGERRSIYKPVQQRRRNLRRAAKFEGDQEYTPVRPKKKQQKDMEEGGAEEKGNEEEEEGDEAEDLEEEDDKRSLDRKRATSSAREEKQYQLMLEKAIRESRRTSHPDDDSESQLPEVDTARDMIENSDTKQLQPEQEVEQQQNDKNEHPHASEKDLEQPQPRRRRGQRSSSGASSSEDDLKRKRRATRKSRRDGSATSSNPSSNIGINKPIKPRLPSQRTTLNEMKRRVAAILEFISRTQLELSQDQLQREQLVEFVENREFVHRVDQIFQNYDESLQMMDALTRKLLLWEKKYTVDQVR